MSDKEDLIRDEFKRVFGSFSYPFKTSDQLLLKLSETKKRKYLRDASLIKVSPVTIQELNEICRTLYYELAVNVKKGEPEEMLYKGALLFASKYKTRINQLAAISPEVLEESLKEAQKRINEILPE